MFPLSILIPLLIGGSVATIGATRKTDNSKGNTEHENSSDSEVGSNRHRSRRGRSHGHQEAGNSLSDGGESVPQGQEPGAEAGAEAEAEVEASESGEENENNENGQVVSDGQEEHNT